MIRAVALAGGLLAGLLLAVVAQGRQGHLAVIFGDNLPGWTHAITSEASLLGGRAAPLARRLMLEADWRLTSIGAAGPVWRLRLSGSGVDVAGNLTLAADGDGHLNDLTGRMDAAALAVWEGAPAFAADLQITRAFATLDHRRGALRNLHAEGLARGVVLGERALDEGRFTAGLEADGRWHLRLTLAAGQAEVEVDGDAQGGLLRLYVDEAHPELLPQGWGRPLPSAGNRLMVSHLLPLKPPFNDDVVQP